MRILFLTAALMVLPTFAQAHVTANPNEGKAGGYFETKFRVSHGCEGSDTTEIHLSLPKGTVIAKPQFKPGWTVEVKKSKLDKPVPAGHGKMTDEQIDEIIWKGNVLPDDQYDEFGIITKLPDEPRRMLWFPVKQVCENGENNWNEIPAEDQQWHDLKSPAPFVKIAPGTVPQTSGGHKH